MKFIILMFAAASSLVHAEYVVGKYALTRTILVQRCESEKKCDGETVLEDKGREEIEFHYDSEGDCGEVKRKAKMGKTPFNIEIVACRSVKGITTYAMLRSGPTIKRHGVVKMHKSSNNTLVDKPIEIGGKFYRAKLILEPEGLIPAKIPEPYELEQTLVIEACDINGNCETPALMEEKFSDKITLQPMVNNQFCKGSIFHWIKFKKYEFGSEAVACCADGNCSLYTMLHSAYESNKYNVVIKTHDKDEWILKGKLVKIDGKYYRARLILNPKIRGVTKKS